MKLGYDELNASYSYVSGNGRTKPQYPTDRPLTDKYTTCRHSKKI